MPFASSPNSARPHAAAFPRTMAVRRRRRPLAPDGPQDLRDRDPRCWRGMRSGRKTDEVDTPRRHLPRSRRRARHPHRRGDLGPSRPPRERQPRRPFRRRWRSPAITPSISGRPAGWTSDGHGCREHVENGILLAALYNGVARRRRLRLAGPDFLKTRVTPTSLGHPLGRHCRGCRRTRSAPPSRSSCWRRIDRLIAQPRRRSRCRLDAPPRRDAHVVKSVVTNNAVQVDRDRA